MKVAVVYNSLEGCVMQHRGPKVHEIYPLHNVQCIVDAGLCNRLQDFFGEISDDVWIRLGVCGFFAKMPEYLASMCALVFTILAQ